MRQTSVSPEEWVRHRKLRKKIASAKWYARRKQREIDEQNEHRRHLEERLVAHSGTFSWPDPERRAEWHAVVAHHCLGYPPRDMAVSAVQWRAWVERIEREIRHLRETAVECEPTWGHWLEQTFVCKILRQMALRECRGRWPPNTHPTVPRGCVPPNQCGRLWSTSVWNYLWILTHLGNHRECFAEVWNHLHQLALCQAPPPSGTWEDWHLLRSDPDCCRWIQLMSQNLADSIHTTDESDPVPPPPSLDASQSSQGSDAHRHNVPDEPEYHTQPDTPAWSCSLTDTDSESLPSSLDTFVNDAFTH